MNFRQDFFIKKNTVITISLLGFLELFFVSIFLLFTESRQTQGFLFGLLKRGFVELAVFFLLSFAFLGLFIWSVRSWENLTIRLQSLFQSRHYVPWLVSIIGIVIGWVAVTVPPDFFGRFSGYYQWLRPALAVFGLIGLQGTLLCIYSTGRWNGLRAALPKVWFRVFVIVFLSALLVFFFAYLTGFGVISDTPLWNVPGIPISGTQMFLLIVVFTVLMFLERFSLKSKNILAYRWVQAGTLVLIYLGAVLIWGLTPLPGDSLSVAPSVANPEPYPMRDARVHDLGALSILFGEGINFRGYTDKPLYMVLLAIFHLVSGYDYQLLEWVQIAFLALIPVIAYLLGKRFHSSLFGFLISVMVITQQRNAIVLSRKISSVNVKILVTETVVLLGVIILTWLLFKWKEGNSKKTMLLTGGIVGAMSLIRLNPLLFLPFISVLIFFTFRKNWRAIFSHLMIFTAGFLIMFLPWVFTGINPDGQPFVLQKIKDVIENRINPVIHEPMPQGQVVFVPTSEEVVPARYALEYEGDLIQGGSVWTDSLGVDGRGLPLLVSSKEDSSGKVTQYLRIMTSHFVHNYITSIMPLPDILSRKSLYALAERDYWSDAEIWDGKLSSGLLRFIIINTMLVSIGVTYSWKKHKWNGLNPLFIFLIYNLAVSISLTSGGRYIVPINWIIFFYYGMGFVFLADSLLHVIRPVATPDTNFENSSVHSSGKIRLSPLLFILVVSGSLIPIANLLIPTIITENPAETARDLFSSLISDRNLASNNAIGVILYPTYIPGAGELLLDFYDGQQVQEKRLPFHQSAGKKLVMNTKLECGDPGMLLFDADQKLTSVYIFRENIPLEYWSLEVGGEIQR